MNNAALRIIGRSGKPVLHRLTVLAASACAAFGSGQAFAAKPVAVGPLWEHRGDAHLQQVLNWTDADRQAASDAAKKLQADLNAAITAKAGRGQPMNFRICCFSIAHRPSASS